MPLDDLPDLPLVPEEQEEALGLQEETSVSSPTEQPEPPAKIGEQQVERCAQEKEVVDVFTAPETGDGPTDGGNWQKTPFDHWDKDLITAERKPEEQWSSISRADLIVKQQDDPDCTSQTKHQFPFPDE